MFHRISQHILRKKAIFYYDTVTDGVYGLAATLSRSLARSTNDNIIFPSVLCSLSNELIFQLMKQPCFVSVYLKLCHIQGSKIAIMLKCLARLQHPAALLRLNQHLACCSEAERIFKLSTHRCKLIQPLHRKPM